MRTENSLLVNPVEHFKHWFFKIERHQYECAGINYRKFVKNKVATWAWAKTNPPEYVLAQGYIFYEAQNPLRYIQIGAEPTGPHIEVHTGTVGAQNRRAYLIRPDQLIRWLETGTPPPNIEPIDFALSSSGLLAWELRKSDC